MAALRDLPYDIPNVRIEWVNKDFGVPLGFWRSVGSSQNGFIVESFVDELAHLAGQDPYEYRRALLGKSARHKAVLELAATKANWGSPLPAGHGRGIAVCFSYGSYAAHVAEVSVAEDGAVRVHKVVGAIDCGIAVNPDQVNAQMEGGFIYALTATLYGKITVDKGRVEQTNFHTYPMLRIAEAPVVETHILDSGRPPAGSASQGCRRWPPRSATRSSPRPASASGACRSTGRRSSARRGRDPVAALPGQGRRARRAVAGGRSPFGGPEVTGSRQSPSVDGRAAPRPARRRAGRPRRPGQARRVAARSGA